MNTDPLNNKEVQRPVGIYVFALWSLARAYAILVDLRGSYLARQMLQELYGFAPKTDHFDISEFPGYIISSGWKTLFPFLCALAFIVLCISLFFGKAWSRSGYLLVSASVVVLQFRSVGVWYGFEYPLHSLAVLGISYWYFRQPKVLDYFRSKASIPPWLDFKVFNHSPDFVLSFSLLMVMISWDMIKVISILILGWSTHVSP